MTTNTLFHVDADRISQTLNYPYLIASLRQTHADFDMPLLDRRITASNVDRLVNLTAWAAGRAIAVKLVGVFPANVNRPEPEPSIQGIVVLLDGSTGRPMMTCDGAEITNRKTAADSALGADYLARKDARTLLVLGAGGLAPHMIRAHLTVRPTIDNILIWNRNPEKAERVAVELANEGIKVHVALSLDDAIPQADIISSVTMATEPLIKGAWLKPGAHVDLVGSYMAEMREADDETMRRAAVICMDTREGYDCTGDIIQPLQAGIIQYGDIQADHFELARAQHSGRQSDDQITVFKNIGGAHLDLFATLALYNRITGKE
ncbi:ornithine cyclodeaminase [Brucella sp. NBRC 113783]|uniref:ornithine cyclodeaminase n=1 Tax=Brucella sp. NBRC 113783 TaxID=3075478 RepID=UPI0029BFD0E8|nr:ornithine cyclodeaminase [Brucella sp. NBRC 113783]MDX4075556.1 ornithine cyclodeaminase [Brucella sp. NBRC 113783]